LCLRVRGQRIDELADQLRVASAASTHLLPLQWCSRRAPACDWLTVTA
jgi:hypothetical protein